jgi:hypothetical protein
MDKIPGGTMRKLVVSIVGTSAVVVAPAFDDLG